MESCLGSIYIHKSIAPFAMNLAFLAQKNVFDLVLLGEFLKNPLYLDSITRIEAQYGRGKDALSSGPVKVL
jgi:hypothetical protein